MGFRKIKRDRILLLNPPARYKVLRDYYCCTHSKTGYLWHPIDLLVQSGILKDEFDVLVCDAIAMGLDRNAALSKCMDLRPSAVFSLVGSMCLEPDLVFLKDLKETSKAAIYVSGDAVLRSTDDFLLQHEWIDAVILNFLAPDIGSLIKGEREKIISSVFRDGENIHSRTKSISAGFRYPLPLHEKFSGGGYNMPFVPARFATVLTTYGCPYNCTFCNSGKDSLGFGTRDFDNLANEIRYLCEQGFRHIFFKDMTFGIDRERTERLCRFMAGETGGMTWHAYTRVDLLDEQRIQMYAASGCRLLQFGIETADGRTGERIRKKIKTDQVKSVLRLLKKHGIMSGAHYIMGLPGSGIGIDSRTISSAAKLNPDYASFNIFRPRPGASLHGALPSYKKHPLIARAMMRAAYLRFYLRPSRIISLWAKPGASGAGSVKQSLSSMMRYLLFLPDMERPWRRRGNRGGTRN